MLSETVVTEKEVNGVEMLGGTASSELFEKLESVEEGCQKLAEFLKLKKPVSRDVFISMVEDSTYAANIIMTRNSHSFLQHMLANPTRQWSEQDEVLKPSHSVQVSSEKNVITAKEELSKTQVIERSNAQLLKKAARSLLVWSGAGAKMVSDEVYETRLSACNQCPHYIEPPEKLVYKASSLLSKKSSNKVCNLCGCVGTNKAKLATESCPDVDPDRPGYTRWGEVQEREVEIVNASL